MRTKTKVLEITDLMEQRLSSSQISMEKHTINPDQLYKTITTLKDDLDRLVALIKRESDEN